MTQKRRDLSAAIHANHHGRDAVDVLELPAWHRHLISPYCTAATQSHPGIGMAMSNPWPRHQTASKQSLFSIVGAVRRLVLTWEDWTWGDR